MGNKQLPVMLSGIQPSGYLCIGNYLGALKNWKEFKEGKAKQENVKK